MFVCACVFVCVCVCGVCVCDACVCVRVMHECVSCMRKGVDISCDDATVHACMSCGTCTCNSHCGLVPRPSPWPGNEATLTADYNMGLPAAWY